MPASPNTYLIYGHGAFDSESLTKPVSLPPNCKLHFAVGHLKEIGDEKMSATVDVILNHCQKRSDGITTKDWWDDPEIKSVIYETYETSGRSIPDYILGDTAGLYAPSTDRYASPQALVIINPRGKKTRLSQILGSSRWKNRHPTTHFVWCGCRAMGFKVQDRPHHQNHTWNQFREDLILEL